MPIHNLRGLQCAMVLIWTCVCLTAGANEKFYINDGETDIVYDEQLENLDVMATVEIALSSFVCWNIVSICAGMFICCFIQTGHNKFADEDTEVPSSSKKETPY
mmetsp:Transcript_72787/g.116108  ORF Transcript_72787/g.116108 Transcript_72787/m.116108 type:complete len:104 (+) Transcript_72787:49-360(+)